MKNAKMNMSWASKVLIGFGLLILAAPSCGSKKESTQAVVVISKQERMSQVLYRKLESGYSFKEAQNLEFARRIEGASAVFKPLTQENQLPAGKKPTSIDTYVKILLQNAKGEPITLEGEGSVQFGTFNALETKGVDHKDDYNNDYKIRAQCFDPQCKRVIVDLLEESKNSSRAIMIFEYVEYVEMADGEGKSIQKVELGFGPPISPDDIFSGIKTSAEEAEEKRKSLITEPSELTKDDTQASESRPSDSEAETTQLK